MTIIDALPRQQALNGNESFIVQAPAGSGKTELLIQRLLVLLAQVSAPEQVLAITFTRKAAGEMRQRLIDALQFAANHPEPDAAHSATTWRLAQKVLQQDQEMQWQILKNPNRLMILTIDAWCAKLTQAAPLMSRFGNQLRVTEDSEVLYQQAARATIAGLDQDAPWADALANLLLHLDNDQSRLALLLQQMLAARDQWLPLVTGEHDLAQLRHRLELGLQHAIDETLTLADEVCDKAFWTEFAPLFDFSSKALPPLVGGVPSDSEAKGGVYQQVANLLLTTQGTLRRQVTKSQGFPAASAGQTPEQKSYFKEMKAAMTAFLQKHQQNHELIAVLNQVRQLPPRTYSEDQWQITASLTQILPVLAAQLSVTFQQQQVVDFIEVSQGAITALGANDNPTDLALNLDYQLQHILIDEFQDTSQPQFRLLELLTRGWQPGDGRTLFLVGDPMQSIYRFRQAEVGLFLRARQSGIGDVALTSLQLQSNFRSQAKVVDWFNHAFSQIFPQHEDMALGAVSYTTASAVHQDESARVQCHALFENQGQAGVVTELVTQAVAKNQNVAVLARTRSHLQEIIRALQQAKIDFQAVEIENLIDQPIIMDCLSLTRALWHLGDRIAWLALLRSPWCGLDLSDLHTMAQAAWDQPIWSALQRYTELSLSESGAQKCAQLVPILADAISQRGQMRWRDLIESMLESHPLVSEYLDFLEQFENSATHFDMHRFIEKLAQAKASTTNTDAAVQLMTIHKSKGLEFDTVIIPSIERRTANDASSLLLWLHRPRASGIGDLILAPIKAASETTDPIYAYVRNQHQQQLDYESARLLYVAATRAKQELHFVGSLQDKELEPASGSFLGMLWPVLAEQFLESEVVGQAQTDNITVYVNTSYPLLRRVLPPHSGGRVEAEQPAQYVLPIHNRGREDEFSTVSPAPACGGSVERSETKGEFKQQKILGTLIHKSLQLLSEGVPLAQLEARWAAELTQHFIPLKQQPPLLEQISRAIHNTLEDSRGQWILNPNHREGYAEFAMSLHIDKEVQHIVIDRTFIDEHNTRWIIDYKTTEQVDNVVARYQQQLNTYAQAFPDAAQIKLGLYLPLQPMWFEWDYPAQESSPVTSNLD